MKNKNIEDNRFPFKLEFGNAHRIIDISCFTWRATLANWWAKDLLLHKCVIISQDTYIQMCKECTEKQHELFDDIFGKDEPKFIYKPGDYITVIENTHKYLNGIPGKTYKILKLTPDGLLKYESGRSIDSQQVKVRHATPKEIEAYNSYNYRDLELVCGKHTGGTWELRYTTGRIVDNSIECYQSQKKSGIDFVYFRYYKPATGVILPYD